MSTHEIELSVVGYRYAEEERTMFLNPKLTRLQEVE